MAAPVGNKYAVGNCGGSSLARYKSASEMQLVIDRYFETCKGEVLKDSDGTPIYDKYGQPVIVRKPPTVTGLALALGFNTRLALLNYQNKKSSVNTISRAKARIEEYAETRLFDRDGVNGAKFSLANNFKGWKETQGLEITGLDGQPLIVQNVLTLPDADLDQLLTIMERNQIQGEVIDVKPIEE